MNYIVLINKDNKIKDSFYKNLNLVNTKDVNGDICQVEEKTYEAYLKLKEFLKEKNLIIGIDSAYRSTSKQQEIYDDFVIKYGVDYAKKTVAPVGSSEHHTGLAIDIVIYYDNHFLVDNNELMEHESTYLEIHKYLEQFGFILRYQKEKENITGYPYEPWHIRYVGKIVAKICNDNNWSLEEYLKKFRGVLIVNKKQGMTSFDVVNEISHIFGIKKVGHTGTLDPMAEGVLVITIGKYTKLGELLTATYKEYQAGVLLGIKTDTLDITGKVTATSNIPENVDLEKIINSFKKTYLQEVPIYSAVKINGKKLYQYARNNEQVELPKKEVTIKNIELLTTDNHTFIFKCLVSKGCYIRSLINDIGLSMGTFATMTKLTRTKQGKFKIEDASTLEEIKNNKFNLLKIDDILDFSIINIDGDELKKVQNGATLENKYNIKDKVVFKDSNNKLIAIYFAHKDLLKNYKNFM